MYLIKTYPFAHIFMDERTIGLGEDMYVEFFFSDTPQCDDMARSEGTYAPDWPIISCSCSPTLH